MSDWLNSPSNKENAKQGINYLNKGNIIIDEPTTTEPRAIREKCFKQKNLINKDNSLLHKCKPTSTQNVLAVPTGPKIGISIESSTKSKKSTRSISTQTKSKDTTIKSMLPESRIKSLFVLPETKAKETYVNSKGTLTNGGPLANTTLEMVPKKNCYIATGLVSHVASSMSRANRRMLRGKLIAVFNNMHKLARTGGHIVFNDYHRFLGHIPKYIEKGIEIKINVNHNQKMIRVKNELRLETFLECRSNLIKTYENLKVENFTLIKNIHTYLDKHIRTEDKKELTQDFMRRTIATMNQIKTGTFHLQHKKHTKKANTLFCNTPHMCKTNKIWIKDYGGKIATGDPTKTVNYCNKNHYCPSIMDYNNPMATKTWDLGHSENEVIDLNKIDELDKFDYSTSKIDWNMDDWSKLLQDFSSRHPIPPIANNEKLLDDFERDWARMLYGARWKTIIDKIPQKNVEILNTPFEGPFIRLPEPMDREKEKSLEHMKTEIKKKLIIPKSEIDNVNTWKNLKNFLKEKDMMIVSTDKTKKQVIMERKKLITLGEKFLKSKPT
jgi:hypothetical protein